MLSTYTILNRVTPVLHSNGNYVKRAIMIVTKRILFKRQVTILNITGKSLASFGVFTYSVFESVCKQSLFWAGLPFLRPSIRWRCYSPFLFRYSCFCGCSLRLMYLLLHQKTSGVSPVTRWPAKPPPISHQRSRKKATRRRSRRSVSLLERKPKHQ